MPPPPPPQVHHDIICFFNYKGDQGEEEEQDEYQCGDTCEGKCQINGGEGKVDRKKEGDKRGGGLFKYFDK